MLLHLCEIPSSFFEGGWAGRPGTWNCRRGRRRCRIAARLFLLNQPNSRGWEMTPSASSRLAFALLFCVALPLRGQEARGTLLGRVTDPSGGVIVGARLEATNTDTGVHTAVTANESGDYLLP